MNVLVTGGAGFIGSHLCERLVADGHFVACFDNFCDFYDPTIKLRNISAMQGNPKFRMYVGDIRDILDVEHVLLECEVDMVIHLAAMAGVRPSLENPLLYNDVNITGTMNLLEACRRRNVQYFVLASSSSVYGNNEKVPFAESDSVDSPISPYAATKKACELLGHTYRHLFGMSVVALRFFTVYGPRQRPDLAIHKFTRLLRDGKPIPMYGDGSTRRDYTYIDDIIDGILKAMWFALRPGVYEVFNLGESRTISLQEMISTIAEVMGVTPHLEQHPMQPGDVNVTYADISKSRELLGYDPRTDFRTGVERFVEWFRTTLL